MAAIWFGQPFWSLPLPLPYTIPLLANTQTRSSKNRVTWTLKFTLPAPAAEGATRRFSAVPRGYGPSGAQYGPVRPVRAQTLGLYIPDSIREWLLSGAPRIYDRKDLDLPGNRQLTLPSILTRYYFCSELTIHQFESLRNARQAEDDRNWMLLPLSAVE